MSQTLDHLQDRSAPRAPSLRARLSSYAVPALAIASVAAVGVLAPSDDRALYVIGAAFALTAAIAGIVTSPRSQTFVRTVFRGPGRAACVAFTFDDGPDPVYTPRILDVLRQKGAKATFFVVGRAAEAHPQLVRRIAAEGHELGSHTYAHESSFHFRTSDEMAAEIGRAVALIERLSGQRPRYFRPPHGVRPPPLRDALAAQTRRTECVTWTVRGLDTLARDPAPVVARIERALAPGAIVALHDGTAFGGLHQRDATVSALATLLDRCRSRSLRCVTLRELLSGEDAT